MRDSRGSSRKGTLVVLLYRDTKEGPSEPAQLQIIAASGTPNRGPMSKTRPIWYAMTLHTCVSRACGISYAGFALDHTAQVDVSSTIGAL